mgnify:CR=1 FL=1
MPYVIQWEKQGVAIPIYIWYDGYKAHQGEGYEGRVSLTGQASLNLSQVRETDQGFYHCLVKFLNRPPEPIKNGTWVHLDVLGKFCCCIYFPLLEIAPIYHSAFLLFFQWNFQLQYMKWKMLFLKQRIKFFSFSNLT